MIERTSEQHLRDLVEVLVRRGEDKDELDVWLSIFPSLSEEQQTNLLKLLTEELEQLRIV